MNKCVRIRVEGGSGDGSNFESLVKHARKLSIEGSVQQIDTVITRIIACGEREAIELFVDGIHRIFDTPGCEIFVEPFLKDRDYRGVFRTIE